MGGGASKKSVDFEKCAITPKHTAPYFIQLDVECAEFPTAPLWSQDADMLKREGDDGKAKTVRSVFIKMFADNTPYACEPVVISAAEQ